jgi:hypothetical protein
MNRQIKFRIWDKIRGYYLLNRELTNELLTYEAGLSDIEIEQFTGLFDINGEEIYEGDIISRMICRNSFIDSSLIEQKKLIKFNPYCGYGLTEGEKDIPYGWGWKIIGNKHQTPELLTA